jgi:hypothetical protein
VRRVRREAGTHGRGASLRQGPGNLKRGAGDVAGGVAAEEIGGSSGEVKAGSTRSDLRGQRDLFRATGCWWMQRVGLRPGPRVIFVKKPASVAVRLGTRSDGPAHAITHTETNALAEA